MATSRFPAAVAALAALVLLAGPGMRLYAALPCHAGAPMACCDGENGTGGSHPPCNCTISPAAPSQAVVEAAAPVTVPDAAPTAALVEPAAPPAPAPAAVPERARAGPLFVLFVAFLN